MLDVASFFCSGLPSDALGRMNRTKARAASRSRACRVSLALQGADMEYMPHLHVQHADEAKYMEQRA